MNLLLAVITSNYEVHQKHIKKCNFRGKKGKIDKVSSLPNIWNYEVTYNNDAHFSALVNIYEKKIATTMTRTLEEKKVALIVIGNDDQEQRYQ